MKKYCHGTESMYEFLEVIRNEFLLQKLQESSHKFF